MCERMLETLDGSARAEIALPYIAKSVSVAGSEVCLITDKVLPAGDTPVLAIHPV